MTDIQTRGATADEWFHFDFVLGLGANLLPCVPAGPDVRVVPKSALENKVGKIPSQFNREGLAHGLLDWQKRPILENEVALWAADRRLNICIRLGAISGVYAFDIDIESDKAAEVGAIVFNALRGSSESDPIAARRREGSKKFLIPFRMEGVKCSKRKIFLQADHKGPAIELLADGQQFVAAGSHSSGRRYSWDPGLPTRLPVLTLEQLDRVWAALDQLYSAKPTVSTSTTTPQSSSQTAQSPGSQSTEAVLTTISDEQWNDLRSALRALTSHAAGNDIWSAIGYALLSLQGSRPARQLWIDFSKKADGYQDGAPEKWWDDHARQTPRSDYRHIFNLAKQSAGWGRSSDPAIFPVVQARPVSGDSNTAAPTAQGEESAGGSDGSNTATPDSSNFLAPPLERPLVRLTEASFSTVVRQLEGIIADEVYAQGAHLVRLSEGHEDHAIKRASDSVMLVQTTPSWLRVRLGERATWQRYAPVKSVWYDVDPTAEHPNALFNLGSWRKIKPLDAIARAPFVRADGSICDVEGYDPSSRALLIPSTSYPAIPTNPSRGDAEAALGRLRGVFNQFPWSTAASESAFLAHILSECVRLAIDRCPMFWYTAPDAGTGKGLLQEMASVIVHGNVPSVRPWVGDGDEIRKTLHASLLAGDRSLLFDNVPNGSKVRTPELCAFLTAEDWTDRKLGASEVIGVPNKAIISASGNNVTPVSDLARRSVVVRIDANTEHMKDRVFDIPNLRSYVRAHRAELLVYALTVIKAFYAAKGINSDVKLLPTFEQWSHFVRAPLLWLGMPDPCDTQTDETDDETKHLYLAFEKLFAQFGESEFTVLDIARMAGGISDSTGEMSGALVQAGCAEPNNTVKVGYWLRGVRDKICDGKKLINAGYNKRGNVWRFKDMKKDELT